MAVQTQRPKDAISKALMRSAVAQTSIPRIWKSRVVCYSKEGSSLARLGDERLGFHDVLSVERSCKVDID